MALRLRHTREEVSGEHGYRDAKEFEADLLLMRESLCAHGGQLLAELVIEPVLRKLRTFGFHLSTLDIRQHARVHCETLAEIGTEGWQGIPHRMPLVGLSEQTEDVLQTFKVIAELKKTYPATAIRQYVISGAESEEDVCGAASGGFMRRADSRDRRTILG